MAYNNLRDLMNAADPIAILRALDASGNMDALDPDIAALRMSKIPGVHHKDNLDHSIKVLENIIARVPDASLELKTAALLHDIGKPATRRADPERKTVTFDGHEVVGARMTPKILKRHGYSKREIKNIARMVELHMRSHSFTDHDDYTDSGIRRFITDCGDLRDEVVALSYADVTTSREKNRRTIHAKLDRMVDAIEDVMERDARSALRPAINGNEVMEMFGMKPGRELGCVMKYLNSDEGIALSREDAIAKVAEMIA